MQTGSIAHGGICTLERLLYQRLIQHRSDLCPIPEFIQPKLVQPKSNCSYMKVVDALRSSNQALWELAGGGRIEKRRITTEHK